MYIFKPIDDLLAYMKSEHNKAQEEVLRNRAEIEKLEKRNDTVAVICTVVFLLAVILGSAIMNSPKRLISGRLLAAGYSVNDLEIEKTDISGVYKASVSVVSEDGQIIEMWKVQPVTGFHTIWYATPYPAQPIIKHEVVSLRFTSEEYEQLLSLSQQNGESIEDLIKRQVLQKST